MLFRERGVTKNNNCRINLYPSVDCCPTEYLKHQDLNVISVDYKELVQPPCYVQAVHNVPLVGKCINKFLQKLFKVREDLKLWHLHVIGFSLGAQVAGHVGRLMNNTIERITGMGNLLTYNVHQSNDNIF